MTAQRNLILILAHGLRSDAAGDTLAWPFVSPNLEAMSNRGLRLVATSACPADDGGMVSLLTGLHARQHGQVWSGKGSPPGDGWARWLSEAGYYMAGVGVVGLLAEHLQEAVTVEPVGVINPARCAYFQFMRDQGQAPALVQQRKQRQRYGPFEPDRLLLDPGQDVDGFIGNHAASTLDSLPDDRPWVLVVMFTGPGNDLPAPGLYDQLVDVKELEAGFVPADLRTLDVMADLDYPRILLQRLDARKLARIRGDYLGRVGLIDHAIGRLVERAASRPDAGRTWTVVTSDRGMILGEHGLIGHRSFLCPAVEAPLIVCPPAGSADGQQAPKSQHLDGLVSTVDVAATIAALGGADVPPWVVGRSVLPIIAGQSFDSLARKAGCVSEYSHRLMLQTERHKVIYEVNHGEALALFDLLTDPEEEKNLVNTPQGINVLDGLRWRLADALIGLRSAPRGSEAVQPPPWA